jgi:hypothetical protein
MSTSYLYSDGTSIPLFAGVEDTESMFIATLDELDQQRNVESEVKDHWAFWEYLKNKNLVEYADDIGLYYPVNLRRRAPTGQWISGYDDADRTPIDTLSQAKFPYGHLTVSQMYNREELVKNSGKTQLIDLVKEKEESAMDGLNNGFGETLLGTQDADGKKPMGLGRIVTYGQACGGVNPTVAGFEFWNPSRGLTSGGAQYALATAYREGMRRLLRVCRTAGNGVGPDVSIEGEDVYEAGKAHWEGKLQVRLDELKDQQGWGAQEMFTDLDGVTHIYEQSLTAKMAWLINFRRYVKVRIHKGTNFSWQPWMSLPGKVQTKTRDNLTYVSVACKRRAPNGTITYT